MGKYGEFIGKYGDFMGKYCDYDIFHLQNMVSSWKKNVFIMPRNVNKEQDTSFFLRGGMVASYPPKNWMTWGGWFMALGLPHYSSWV